MSAAARGMATFTIVASRITISCEIPMTSRAIQRFGSRSDDASSTPPAGPPDPGSMTAWDMGELLANGLLPAPDAGSGKGRTPIPAADESAMVQEPRNSMLVHLVGVTRDTVTRDWSVGKLSRASPASPPGVTYHRQHDVVDEM